MGIRVHMRNLLLSLASVVAAGAAAASAGQGVSTLRLPNPAGLEKMSETPLKAAYIACNARARKVTLPTTEAARCAMMHRELLDRVFGGDAKAFNAWWVTTNSAASKSERPLGAPGAPSKKLSPEKPVGKPVNKPAGELNDVLHLPAVPGVPALPLHPVADQKPSKAAG